MEWKGFLKGLVQRTIECILVWLSSLSLSLCIGTNPMFSLDVDIKKAAIILLLFSLWFMLVCMNKWTALFFIPCSLFLWGVWLWHSIEQVVEEKDLLAVMFPAVMLIGISIYLYKSSMVLVVFTIIFIVLFLNTDVYPSAAAFFLCLACTVSACCVKKNGGHGMSMFFLVISFTVLLGIHQFLSPSLGGILEGHTQQVRLFQQNLNHKMHNFMNRMNGTTQINGNLNNEDPGNGSRTDLMVYVSTRPMNNIYLRGFVGDNYDGSSWSEISDEAFRQAAMSWQLENMSYQYPMIQSKLISQYAIRDQARLSQIWINFVHYSGKFVMTPYGISIASGDRLFADGEMLRNGTDEISFYYAPNINYNASGEDAFWRDAVELAYDEYVHANYLSTNMNLIHLNALCDSMNGSTFFTARDSIRGYLVNNCRYALDLDPLPYGVDFTEYFLFNQHKGYCMHFATAATLMFRRLGYPARFVTGYVVRPTDFARNEQGEFVAKVPSKNAHAWTEVYLDGIWYPVEMTPGYIATANDLWGENIGPVEDDEEDETEEDSQKADDKPLERVTEAEEETAEEAIDVSVYQRWLFGIAGMMFLCLLVLIFRRILILRIYAVRFAKKHDNEFVRDIARYTLKMLERRGYKQKDMSDIDYAQTIPSEGFVRFMEIAQEASFSRHVIPEEKVEYCLLVKQNLEQQLYSGCSKKERLIWKYWYCYR